MIDIDEIIVMPEKQRLPLDIRPGREEGMAVFLEIGFGNGEFITHLARENPGNLFWGVEMSRSCVLRALKRVRTEKLSNVFLMCGDARFILKECIPKESLDGIYMNFPCPWPKKKHSKRRVSSGDFPSEIAKVLRMGAFFELVTDEEWYGREVRDVLNMHPALELNAWCTNPPRTVTTKYERKWLQMGKKIFLSRHKKKERLSGDGSCSSGRAEEMHVRVSGKKRLNSFVKELYDRGGENVDAFWMYKRSYTSGNGVYLVEVVAGDGSFEQKFFLQIVEREDDILVKIAPYSSPFLTDSVRGALEGLASMIESHCMSHAPDVPMEMDSLEPGLPR